MSEQNQTVIDTPVVETEEYPVYDCMVPRRGKGAKGFVAVQTFGKPIKMDENGVPTDWDYSHLRGLTDRKCFDITSRFSGKIDASEAHFRGFDMMLKSANMQANSKAGMLLDYIIEHGLSQDLQDAENLANIWKQTIAFMTKSGMPEPSLEDLHSSREVAITRLKSAGLWKTTFVKHLEPSLVKDETDVTNQESPNVDAPEIPVTPAQ